ncbi:hypothetical protein [Stackebrandtia nassauensis]|uniref:Uncharacterized protein n=1 Tax=Stackebrandtia nassauensis (strain DSM 44728 / CIP 108903 / NRRL B-16338 / NBRC 102104 / LLR-40K-21) TaxID=446470 RepID=D3QA00_STANL|nr:hypothetical protein [Stackebrandtia nassauensis]ADD40712.1 hypothetical protein Snas_1002 [Stackebrandtia nassauensis DSM 44728]
MIEETPPGHSATYSVFDLDINEIDQASRTDFEKVSEMETRRDGWSDYRDMMADMKADIEAELPNLRDNFKSAAGNVFVEALEKVVKATEDQHEVAESNRKSTDSIITEVKRVRPLIEEIVADRALANENRNELQSMSADGGKDAYSQALEDTLYEARRTFSESNSTYSQEQITLNPPPKYSGPVYTGPSPETPLDGNYQHAYYPDPSSGQGGTFNGAGNNGGATGGPNGGSTERPGTVVPGDRPSDGPELQNPGTPAPSVPGPGPGPTVPGAGPNLGGGGPVTMPPPVVPGTSGPTGPVGGKPVIPPGTKPTTGPLGGAKPTPGMVKPTTGPGMVKPTTGPGVGAKPTGPAGAPAKGANTAPKNSLLPNQRQAAAGRTPVTGAGRVPTSGGGTGGPRGVTSANAVRPSAVPNGGRGGVVRGAPNKGFEESMYRGTRAGRTVPGVIGARSETAGSSAPGGRGSGGMPPRVASAGKVIGERKNKGQRGRSGPKLQSGSLTDTTARSKKDTRHTWQRMPVERPVETPAGSMAISRNAQKRPMTPDEIAEAKLQARKKWRKQFYASKQEPKLEPASELFGGTEGKVTRGVIRGTAAPQPVDRRDAGTRFSTYGWENDN